MDRHVLFMQLHAAARVALTVLVLRAFPVVVAFSGSEAVRGFERAVAVVTYSLLGCLAVGYAHFDVAALTLTYCYFAITTPIPYLLAKVTRRRSILFMVTCSLFMIAPALVQRDMRITMMVLGWDLMLSAYSYCVTAAPKRFGDYFWFVFVNPALVYSRRGTVVAPPGIEVRALGRVATGLALTFASQVMPLLQAAAVEVDAPALAIRALTGTTLLAQFYGAQAGLASIQSGLCRQLGFEVPERYVRPFGATSPRDFWSRWNTYVGTWARVYVFQRVAFYLARRWRLRGHWAAAIAVFVTFVCVGLLHDLNLSLARNEMRHWGVTWFAMNAAVLVAWESIARAAKSKRIKLALPELGSRALVFVVAVVMAAAIPS
jgi:hypothetical protein